MSRQEQRKSNTKLTLALGATFAYDERDVGRSLPIRLGQARLAEIALSGIPVPTYDRARLEPAIVHVGVGGFHRAHLAVYVHELASRGSGWGIAGLGLLAGDAEMAAALSGQDCLYTLIEKDGGEHSAQVIGSITSFVHAPPGHDAAAAELIAAPATAILSLTVTESGYAEPSAEEHATGERTTFDRIAAALAIRRDRGARPDHDPELRQPARERRRGSRCHAVRRRPARPRAARVGGRALHVSELDGRSHHAGHLTRGPRVVARQRWRRGRLARRLASRSGSGSWRTTSPASRPPWEDAGALFTDRIDDWEQYKLRMLNAGHSCIAYLSALAGITYVHEAIAVPAMRTFLEGAAVREAIPTLAEIPGHPREEYAASVLERFANAGVRDQIARVCIDGSAKFPTFLIPTLERQVEHGGPIERAATALAGWARYLAVVDPAEQAFDAAGDVARRHAAEAAADPSAFLAYEAVFTPAVRSSSRFRVAFVTATSGSSRAAADRAR